MLLKLYLTLKDTRTLWRDTPCSFFLSLFFFVYLFIYASIRRGGYKTQKVLKKGTKTKSQGKCKKKKRPCVVYRTIGKKK